jgi:uncharacterized membrane protein
MKMATCSSGLNLPGKLALSAPAIAAGRAADTEDRILRVWTPLLLRVILSASVTLLTAGLILSAVHLPGRSSDAAATVARGSSAGFAAMRSFIAAAAVGDGSAIATLGLFVLTLVPLARVAFCFILFLKQKSMVYAAFTAYVLAGLVAGILLGRIG